MKGINSMFCQLLDSGDAVAIGILKPLIELALIGCRLDVPHKESKFRILIVNGCNIATDKRLYFAYLKTRCGLFDVLAQGVHPFGVAFGLFRFIVFLTEEEIP